MKKLISFVLTLLMCLPVLACTYSAGSPDEVVKAIEMTASDSSLKTGEKAQVMFVSVKQDGTKEELHPDSVEIYFEDADIMDATVEKGNTFSFSSAKKYKVRARLKNELSVKGKMEFNVYDEKSVLALQAKKLDDIKYATETGKDEKKEIKAKLPLDTEPLKEDEVYEYLKENGATEIKAAAKLDCKKYYKKEDYSATLDLTYFTVLKITKDSKPVTQDESIKLFIVDSQTQQCKQIMGNIGSAKGFTGVDYAAIVGKPEGEKFTGSVLTSEIEPLYSSDPALFEFSKDITFLVLCQQEGRYEITIDAVLKEQNKKFFSESKLLIVKKAAE